MLPLKYIQNLKKKIIIKEINEINDDKTERINENNAQRIMQN